MKKYSLILFIAALFSACSFKTPPNQWQRQSADAFNSYVKDFMHGEDSLAKNDLRRAVKHAKKSADLTTLARVYLGKCALNVSVGVADKCEEYKSVSTLVEDEELSNYYGVITKTSTLNPNAILDKNRATSILLNGALKKDTLNDAQRAKYLQVASYNGYKKAVLFWLNESKINTSDEDKKEIFQQKIEAIK